MKKIYFLLFLLSFLTNAQIFRDYPKDQNAYQKNELYKDIHEILLKNFNPCANKNKLIWLKVLINDKGNAEFIENNTENKCANDLANGIMKHLNKWIPAKFKRKNVNTIANFIFFPDDLFENYRDGYSPINKYIVPQFPEGINQFRQQLMQSVTIPDSKKGVLKFIVLFDVDKFGVINNIVVESSEINTDNFQKNIINAIEKLQTKWIPAKYKGLSIDAKFRMPVTIYFD